jgi:hypothetical protein
VLRAIEGALAVERDKRQGRDRLIGVHGNRLIAHLVFQRLLPGALSDSKVDFETTLATIPDLVSACYGATIQVINTRYDTNYLASLFKNGTRCKDIVQHAALLGVT